MPKKELLEALQKVHHELEQAEHLDAAEVERLRATMREIQSVIEDQADQAAPLSEQVSESARSFEESHPVLTNTLGRIADMLQQMGI
ncbi:DUF4404 family protein [Novipirellula artificiosorum]|uniref:DUF4404 domain-containing protein n=1 Tax=Novipirellula artificiosorum TaxID=2528016 RepID=A0A5C6E318_9BACT|nr:DUF4404 family protein [Novipirellula artificiosorum]TWU42894.1 hypothetical protein Poly41_11950 [Novipirellula artificiosorum]